MNLTKYLGNGDYLYQIHYIQLRNHMQDIIKQMRHIKNFEYTCLKRKLPADQE